MSVEMGVFLTFGGSVILLFLLGKTLLIPLKIVFKLVVNSLLVDIEHIVIGEIKGEEALYFITAVLQQTYPDIL